MKFSCAFSKMRIVLLSQHLSLLCHWFEQGCLTDLRKPEQLLARSRTFCELQLGVIKYFDFWGLMKDWTSRSLKSAELGGDWKV